MNPMEFIHDSFIFGRRIKVLSNHLTDLIPENSRLLDVGCGDGSLAKLIVSKRPDIQIQGLDILIREQTHIAVEQFDGTHIPYSDNTYDSVMLIDVLHHTADPLNLLRESIRVTTRSLLIKDHTSNSILAEPILRFMDRIGNCRHGVPVPGNYWSDEEWEKMWQNLSLKLTGLHVDLGLYPWPVSLIFDRQLHFIAHLDLPENH